MNKYSNEDIYKSQLHPYGVFCTDDDDNWFWYLLPEADDKVVIGRAFKVCDMNIFYVELPSGDLVDVVDITTNPDVASVKREARRKHHMSRS